MFDKEFYPTPQHIVQRLLNGENVLDKNVLEPSAGSGNILDELNSLGAKTFACEKNDKLRLISKEKSDVFMCDDFFELTKEDVSHIDYIIMNPPFSNADKHIEHAWNIAPNGCQIHALCNAETIKNSRYSMSRTRLVRIVEENGFSEEIGDVFSESERKTDVIVSIVRLFKPPAVENDDWSEYFSMDSEIDEEQENGVVRHNVIYEMVQRYTGALKLFDEVSDNAVLMNKLIGGYGKSDLVVLISEDDQPKSKRQFQIDLQKCFWDKIFKEMNMDKYLTSQLREEMNAFINRQKNIPFTRKNVYKMIDMIIQTHEKRMLKSIVDSFDDFTKHHHENRYNVEGWKTNDSYIFNKKIIIPFIVKQGWNGEPEPAHSGYWLTRLIDLVKGICYLTGTNYSNFVNLKYDFFCIRDEGNKIVGYKDYGIWHDYAFFEVKFFKKGTMHLKFKDIKVWELLNITIAKEKGFELPEKIK